MPGGGGPGSVGSTQMIVIDGGRGASLQGANRDLVGVMDDMNLGGGDLGMGGEGADDDEDDLLGLMDAARG